MKKILLLLVLSVVACSADEITFSFILGAPGSLNASASGAQMGIAENVLVSDATTGKEFTLLGTFSASTGRATSFGVTSPGIVRADYLGAGRNSVLIVDQFNNPLVAGRMDDHGRFLSGFPDGRGAFAGAFDVSFVSPAVLSLFGLGPEVLPTGSVSATFAEDNFDGVTVTGQLGGGTVTVETTEEPAAWTLGVLGVAMAGLVRMRQYARV